MSTSSASSSSSLSKSELCDQKRELGRSLLLSILSELVAEPESLSVQYVVGDQTTVFKVECNQACIGQVIGSKGRNINSLRTLLAAILGKNGIRAIIEIPFFVDQNK